MTTQESYVKLIMNSDGKVQPELFISGELDILDTIDKFNNLTKALREAKYIIPEHEASYEIKNMSGWKQLTVRGTDLTQVMDKFNELAKQYPTIPTKPTN